MGDEIYFGKDLIEKIDKALSSVFIGDVIFDEDEIECIKEYVNYVFNDKTNYKNNEIFKRSLLVLIINFAKSWGDDDNDGYFYRKVFSNIFDDNTLTLTSFDLIYYFHHDLKRIWLKDNEGNTTRYKQTLLFNAFSPKESIFTFIDIVENALFDKENANTGFFDERYEDNPAPYIKFVNSYAKQILKINDEEEEVNIYGASYKLSTALRHGFIYDGVSVAILVSRTIDYIKKFYNKDAIVDGTYYSKLVNAHLTEISHSENYNKKTVYVEKVKTIDDWYAYYSFSENGHLYVKMPMLRLESIDQYGEYITISINRGDERLIEYKKAYVSGKDYNPHIDEVIFDVTKSLRSFNDLLNFKINVYDCNNNLIFTSEEKLYRDFIIFQKGYRKEIKANYINPKDGKYFAILPEFFALEFADGNYVSNFEPINENPCILRLNPSLGEEIFYGSKYVLFTEAKEVTNYRINGKTSNSIIYENSFLAADVYRTLDSIVFEMSKDFIEGDGLVIEWTNNDNGNIHEERLPFVPIDISQKEIKVSRGDYSILENKGLFTFKVIRNDIKRTIISGFFYVADIKASISPHFPSPTGYHEVVITKDGQEIIRDKYALKKEGIEFSVDGNAFRFINPYFRYKLQGYSQEEYNYLNAESCMKIYYKDITDDFAIKIDTTYYDVILNDGFEDYEYNGKVYIKDINRLKAGRNDLTVKVKISDFECDLFKVYYEECIIDDAFVLNYDEDHFDYYIGTFIGDKNPEFEIVIYDLDDNDEYTVETYSYKINSFNGNFEIEGFMEGWYSVKLFRLLPDGTRGKTLVILDEIELGNADKTQFDDTKILLTKTSNKDKLQECEIDSINYYCRNEYSVYTGILRQGKIKPINIYFEDRNGTISIFSDYDKYEPLYFDASIKKLTTNNKDNTEVRSCYYHVVELPKIYK